MLKILIHIVENFQVKLFYLIQDLFSMACDALPFLDNSSDPVFNINISSTFLMFFTVF